MANLDQLKIAPTNNQIMYSSRGVFMYRTSDGGATDWSQVTSPGGVINSIAIHPTNPDKIAVAHTGAGKVRVSNDGGTTWQDYLLNLPNFSALAVIWDDNGADALYVGMDYGIYYIDNTFADWQPYSSNLPNVIINELDINNETNLLYAGSYGRGTWVSPLGNPALGIADRFSEDNIQVYPNPANSEITISLPTASEVDIRVFDLLGKLRIYEADVLVANRHTIGLTTLSSGVYFIRINSEKGTVTKKFIKE